jgi:hypothetical protein
LVLPDKDLAAFKTKIGRQAYRLASAVEKELGCARHRRPPGSDIYHGVSHEVNGGIVKRAAETVHSGPPLTAAAEADSENRTPIAAVNRCATQNQGNIEFSAGVYSLPASSSRCKIKAREYPR